MDKEPEIFKAEPKHPECQECKKDAAILFLEAYKQGLMDQNNYLERKE